MLAGRASRALHCMRRQTPEALTQRMEQRRTRASRVSMQHFAQQRLGTTLTCASAISGVVLSSSDIRGAPSKTACGDGVASCCLVAPHHQPLSYACTVDVLHLENRRDCSCLLEGCPQGEHKLHASKFACVHIKACAPVAASEAAHELRWA